MPPIHGNTSTFPARTAFLRGAERQEVAAGIGLAELAMWYANEGIAFDASVAALGERAGHDATAARVAYECLAFTEFSHSTHAQVMALFVVNELRCRIERAQSAGGGIKARVASLWRRLLPLPG